MDQLKESLASELAMRTDLPIHKVCEFVDEKLVWRSERHLWYVVEDEETGFDFADSDGDTWFCPRLPTKVLCLYGDPRLPVCWEV